MHYLTVPAPGVMVWSDIGFYSRIPLVRINGTHTSQRYISEVLQLILYSCIQRLPAVKFHQDTARPHVVRNVQDSLLAYHITYPVLPDIAGISDALWLRVKATWPVTQ